MGYVETQPPRQSQLLFSSHDGIFQPISSWVRRHPTTGKEDVVIISRILVIRHSPSRLTLLFGVIAKFRLDEL
jgi:hypothetical protein